MAIVASFVVPHPPLIVNEVGRGREKEVEKTIQSYEQIAKEIEALKPETIIISSPHTRCYQDYFYLSSGILKGDFSTFGARNISFEETTDEELASEIEKIAYEEKFPAGRIPESVELDHGTMVPLYFIRKQYSKSKILVVGLSGLSLENHFHLGQIISEAVNHLNKKVVFVASGDLSHKLQTYGPYGYAKEGTIYEERIQNTLTNADFQELLEYEEDLLEKSAECGHPSFAIMAGAWNHKKVKSTFLSHEDITGVGYGIWTFYEEKDELVQLARSSIESYIKYQRRISIPSNTSEELYVDRKGVFVSIHKNGQLRGCIGTFYPIQNCMAREIIENAISAATKDPRFSPITEDELNDLEIKVDVLTTPEKIESEKELNPKKYGVIVKKDFRRGLLLPDLEGIDTIEEQISIAKEKANIREDEDVELWRFEVTRHY